MSKGSWLTHKGYPVLVNSPEETQKAIAAATALVGADKVEGEMEPTMGGEDFAFMLQKKPGCYVFMGNGDSAVSDDELSASQAPPCMLHNPGYDFNDKGYSLGSRLLVSVGGVSISVDYSNIQHLKENTG